MNVAFVARPVGWSGRSAWDVVSDDRVIGWISQERAGFSWFADGAKGSGISLWDCERQIKERARET